MTLDFDPMQVPKALAKWLALASEADQEKHATVFARRAVAALHVLKAVAELRASHTLVHNPHVEQAIRDLLEVARDLHDYDPTSD